MRAGLGETLKFKNFSNSDVSEFERSILVNANTFQLSPARLTSIRNCYLSAELTLFYRKENLANLTVINQQNDQYLLILPFSNLTVNGIKHKPNELLAFCPGDTAYCLLDDDFACIGMSFSTKQALNYVSHSALSKLQVYGQSLLAFNKASLNFELFIDYLIKVCEPLSSAQNNSKVLNHLTVSKSLFARLVDSFPQQESVKSVNHKPNQTRKTIVERAFNYLMTLDKTNVPIPELAGQCYCSVRSLEYAFKSILLMTPKQFLTIRKYHLVRSSIKQQKVDSIKSLIQQFGLTNQGRFRLQYEELFGESPKITWQNYSKQE